MFCFLKKLEKYVHELQQMLSSINQHFNQTNIDLSAFIAFDPKIALPSTSIIHEGMLTKSKTFHIH